MLRWSLAYSAGPFWQPAEFENVANLYLENLKHLHNPGHLLMTTTSMTNRAHTCCLSFSCSSPALLMVGSASTIL